MKYIRKATWKEVFESWEKRESKNPDWIRCAKEKGFSSWQEWRGSTASRVNAENLEWGLYNFDNPRQEIPNILVGPFKSWQAKIPQLQQNETSFEGLLKDSDQYDSLTKNTKIISVLKEFKEVPELRIKLIGVIRKDGKIVCAEGHHTITAYSLAKMQNYVFLDKLNIKIFLAKIDTDIPIP
ncbi:MAG: hypothetical protein WC178_02125 [Candidatus Paceibacterota bacterium]